MPCVTSSYYPSFHQKLACVWGGINYPCSTKTMDCQWLNMPLASKGKVWRGGGSLNDYLGRYSVTIDRCGRFVTAPMKRTTFGCLTRFIIATWKQFWISNSAMPLRIKLVIMFSLYINFLVVCSIYKLYTHVNIPKEHNITLYNLYILHSVSKHTKG